MPSTDYIAKIERMALEFADTGPFSNWQEIELLLRYSGYADARSVLDTEAMRTLLNQRCQATMAKLAGRT